MRGQGINCKEEITLFCILESSVEYSVKTIYEWISFICSGEYFDIIRPGGWGNGENMHAERIFGISLRVARWVCQEPA